MLSCLARSPQRLWRHAVNAGLKGCTCTSASLDVVSESATRSHSSMASSDDSEKLTDTYGYSPRDGDQTHFGAGTVDRHEKHKRVAEVFHSVADSYDLMNDLMSGSVHRYWKDSFVKTLGPSFFFSNRAASATEEESVNEICFLDVAGGTGDIAFRICDAIMEVHDAAPGQHARVIISDINPSMLGVGQDRWHERTQGQGHLSPDGAGAVKVGVEFLEASAEDLPLADASVDAYTISFGIRNVTNIDVALKEAFRVLKPGGRFMCLEFSKVNVPGLKEFYEVYSDNVIPALGEKITGDRDSYQYLVESIRRFPPQQAFAAMIRDAGFSEVSFDDMSGGIVCAHSGFKLP